MKNKEISNIIEEIEKMTGCEVISHKATKTNWPNGAMGLQGDRKYTQAPVSGYVIDVRITCCDCGVYDRTYHTNRGGTIIREKK